MDIEVQLIKYQGMSGGFGIKKEDRYKVVLFNPVNQQSRTVDNNDGWGWRKDRALAGALNWANFLDTAIKEYEEKETIQTQIILKETPRA